MNECIFRVVYFGKVFLLEMNEEVEVVVFFFFLLRSVWRKREIVGEI